MFIYSSVTTIYVQTGSHLKEARKADEDSNEMEKSYKHIKHLNLFILRTSPLSLGEAELPVILEKKTSCSFVWEKSCSVLFAEKLLLWATCSLTMN